ncbi:MAG: MnhB domain-containing protein [Dehalococcoidales bacterium]|nr:MnhB domain-containing protein [Dehalococcoidales bacterium]
MVETLAVKVIAKLLLGPIFVVAAAVLAKGYAQVGDGFSAGLIAAIGILLQYVAFGRQETERLLPLRFVGLLAPVGLLIALLVAFVPVMRGEPILTQAPPAGTEAAHLGTLELITALAFDVGVFLVVFGFAVAAMSALARIGEDRP